MKYAGTIMGGGLIDDKIVTARRLLREGKTMAEIAKEIGYKSKESVRYFLRANGIAAPERAGFKIREHISCK